MLLQRLSSVPARFDGRLAFVIHQQRLAQAALMVGQIHAARAALRGLRLTDFERQHRAEIHLGVVRDNRSERRDVHEALVALAHLAPCSPQLAARRKMSAAVTM